MKDTIPHTLFQRDLPRLLTPNHVPLGGTSPAFYYDPVRDEKHQWQPILEQPVKLAPISLDHKNEAEMLPSMDKVYEDLWREFLRVPTESDNRLERYYRAKLEARKQTYGNHATSPPKLENYFDITPPLWQGPHTIPNTEHNGQPGLESSQWSKMPESLSTAGRKEKRDVPDRKSPVKRKREHDRGEVSMEKKKHKTILAKADRQPSIRTLSNSSTPALIRSPSSSPPKQFLAASLKHKMEQELLAYLAPAADEELSDMEVDSDDELLEDYDALLVMYGLMSPPQDKQAQRLRTEDVSVPLEMEGQICVDGNDPLLETREDEGYAE